ncbi:MAG: peptidoglycan DL-endopeptidase CwlO [Actinomycetota bacterium]|nr:peptidoglycan DL-endopeptidase CwlO [Actinomycetota bacterium]
MQRQERALAKETATLTKAALSATATLQAYQVRRREAADAAREVIIQTGRAAAAGQARDAARQSLQAYAGSLYRTGMVDSSLFIVSASLDARGPVQFLNGLRVAQHVAGNKGRAVSGLIQAEADQRDAAEGAKDAVARQRVAEAAAATANTAALKVVAAYQKQVAARRALLASSTTTLKLAQQRDHNVESAAALARDAGWQPSPPCKGKDVSAFPNGMIPIDALCPLLFTATHRLRADAAFAFNAMATEYAGAFGTPLCVTDSYRTYDAQVVVAAEKPTLAAEPGHSNHGWGLAADLCGGIEAFDTPTHQWMVDNAPRFGWFHPEWAELDGSKPEPWHWEFAG